MDSLDSFIQYSFIESLAPVVRSIPLEIDLGKLGKLRVEGRMDVVNQKKLAKDARMLRDFLPVTSKKENLLKVSHLLIPIDYPPHVLHLVLRICLAKLAGSGLDQSLERELLLKAESSVIEQNLSFYQDLLEQVEKARQVEKPVPVLERVLALAALQKSKLETYHVGSDHR